MNEYILVSIMYHLISIFTRKTSLMNMKESNYSISDIYTLIQEVYSTLYFLHLYNFLEALLSALSFYLLLQIIFIFELAYFIEMFESQSFLDPQGR